MSNKSFRSEDVLWDRLCGCAYDAKTGLRVWRCLHHRIQSLRMGETVSLPMNTFSEFVKEVEKICAQKASEKGYNNTGIDGPNDLYEMVRRTVGSDGHAIGEIIYKAIRYARKRDWMDLVKIAAWAFLIFKYEDPHKAERNQYQAGRIAGAEQAIQPAESPVLRKMKEMEVLLNSSERQEMIALLTVSLTKPGPVKGL